jgi:hypothetical protein
MKKMAVCGVFVLCLGLVACMENSDRSIVADANEAIADDQLAGTVRVASDDGLVTLTGTVPDMRAKDRAAEIVGNVDGVDQVINNLRTAAGDAPLEMHDPPGMHDDGTIGDGAVDGDLNSPRLR